jgi:nicotinic acid mononucleotide adenylyltransferase
LPTTDTITLTSGLTYTYAASPSISTLTTSTISTISSIDNIGSFNWSGGKDFIDKFPEWDRIKSMCKQYPSLEIALRNFETIYQLVKDDYDNPTPKK